MKFFLVLAAILGASLALPTRPTDLTDDLNDFLNLIPIEKIDAILDDHLATDGAFVTVVQYMQGPEWAAIVQTVHDNPTVQEFEQYLTDAGLPVEAILQAISDLIANAVTGAEPDANGSLRSFLDEVEEALPVADLVVLLLEKMQTSADFQALYTKVSSPKAHELVETIRALPEVQRIAQRLKDMDVKVDEALAIIYLFLGWGSP